jgi:tRNA uridine 5-carbamoylmethylation protein Kti12
MIITGEPGLGKSVLTQEVHGSLARGIDNIHHSFIPLIVFASDLTLDLLGSTPHSAPELRDMLV